MNNKGKKTNKILIERHIDLIKKTQTKIYKIRKYLDRVKKSQNKD